MTLAYIAIGSNLASPLEQVNAAVQALGEIPQSRIVALSSFYRTPPLGPQDQPDYLNAAVVLETTRDAETSQKAPRCKPFCKISTRINRPAGNPASASINHSLFAVNRLPKIIVPSNVTVRMRKDSLLGHQETV